MARLFSPFCASLLLAGLAYAQSGTAKNNSADSPEDYSGMYTFLREGEFVQLTLEPQVQDATKSGSSHPGDQKKSTQQDPPQRGPAIKVTGFISRYGDLESDRGMFLDHFIKQGSIQDHELSFSTETVHGVWFEFRGTALRGSGKTPNDEAYYVLKGALIEHSGDAQQNPTARSRQVVLKSFPRDVSN